MGNKGAKKSRASTELTPKGLLLIFKTFSLIIISSIEIAMLKANTKFSEKGKVFSSMTY